MYELRDMDKYPNPNPMRKDSSTPIYNKEGTSIYDHFQLPTSYLFDQTDHGVYQRDFLNLGRQVETSIVQVSLSGTSKVISLSEVQVFAIVNGVETNVALTGTASQSSTPCRSR